MLEGIFQAARPDAEPKVILVYKVWTHKKGKIRRLGSLSLARSVAGVWLCCLETVGRGVRKTNGLVTPHPLSLRCILRCPIVSTSSIFSFLLSSSSLSTSSFYPIYIYWTSIRPAVAPSRSLGLSRTSDSWWRAQQINSWAKSKWTL